MVSMIYGRMSKDNFESQVWNDWDAESWVWNDRIVVIKGCVASIYIHGGAQCGVPFNPDIS